jgi:hypothetical protein
MTRHVALFLTTALVLVGAVCCASVEVKAPEIFRIKRVAIVSLYANDLLSHASGRGQALDWMPHMKRRIAEDALFAFAREFSKLRWTVVNPTSLRKSAAYQRLLAADEAIRQAKRGSFVAKAQGLSKLGVSQEYFAPAGMEPIPVASSRALSRDTALRDALAAAAREMRVDGVVVIQVDYCYHSDGAQLAETGQAQMTAAASIHVVGPKGDVLVSMPPVEMCGGDALRAGSDTVAVMQENDLPFSQIDAAVGRRMFVEASRGSARISTEEIRRAIAAQ